jgi:hypothetical protein
MADVNKFSERVIDVAERFADVVDSAQGKGARRSNHGVRWLLLPAAGAATYALATSSSSMARKTRELMGRAKDRASELPDADLFGRVKEVTGSGTNGPSQSRSGRSRPQRRRRTASTSRRKTASTR